MPPSRWTQVKKVLGQVLGLAAAERAAFLDAACEGDEDLRCEVEALLATSDEADAFFGDFAQGAGPALFGWKSLIGERVGAYRIEREIARGGMGTVYLAARADGQFRQQAAIKVLRRGIDTEDVLRRFAQERQILAALSHPGIARLFDGGVTADGRPYFVMEYVEGTPLLEYCEEHGLSVDERLDLFVKVAQAVQHAHQRLVIHRDLKPSNILVTEEADQKPQVKLLDFGVAKLLDPEAGAPLTQGPGLRWMTPAYASPEQMCGGAVTTATDVYGLGVVLYELLTGCRPYQFEACTRLEVERILLNATPPKPSTADVQTCAPVASDARLPGRDARTQALRRRLRGDLDTITLKALRKEPARRYASAEAFAEDIRRHQRQLPVHARPDTLRYRASKFAARHHVGLAVAAFLLLVSFGYALTMQQQMQETARERDKAQQLSEFLIEMFEISDPSEGAGTAVTARELLDRGARRVTRELESQPETRATLLSAIGDIYRRLGLYDRAEPLLETALDERRHLYGKAHEAVGASLYDLAQLRYADGDYAAARLLYEEALAMQRALLGEQHERIATTLSSYAWLLQSTGEYATAESLFTEALAMRQALLGPEHADIAESLNGLGAAFRAEGRYREAEEYYRRGLAMYRAVLGEHNLRVAENLNNLAAVLQDQGRHRDAEASAREALAMYRAICGAEHPDVATSLSNLAYVKQKQGAYEEAETLYRNALAMRQRLLGDDHPHVANSLNNLAALLQDRGRYDQAEPLGRRALAIYRATYGERHVHVAQALTNLAWMVRNRGDLHGAEPIFREMLAMRQRLHGEAHPEVAKSMSYLASLLHELGQDGEAEEHFRLALRLLSTSVSETHPYQAIALTGLGEVLTGRGAAPEAEPLLRRALTIRTAALTEQHWMTAKTQSALGDCLFRQQRYDEAAPLLEQAAATLTATRGAVDLETQRALQQLAALYKAWNRPGRAQEYRLQLATPSDDGSRTL